MAEEHSLRRFTTKATWNEQAPTPATPLAKDDLSQCTKLMRYNHMFAFSTEASVRAICERMTVQNFKKGEVLIAENSPTRNMFAVASGQVERLRTVAGRRQHVDVLHEGITCGSNHLQTQAPAFATVKCATDVKAFALDSRSWNEYLAHPAYAGDVIYNLTMEVRRQNKLLRTPLLKQEEKYSGSPIVATSVGASIESFYRSGLNALINMSLTGHRGAFFPNMHLQIPTRVAYINGFKGIRRYLDKQVPSDASTPVRLAAAVTPGLVMTPISSILEASNAGHKNPEALGRRCTRGFTFRGLREVIFGIGLNQLSDFCEERMPTDNVAIANLGGSLTAGVISGYFSHVPHNMSTLKLMEPHKTYGELFAEYSAKSEGRVPAAWSASSRRYACNFLAIVFPKAVMVRTAQIVGSFMILNGTIFALKDIDFGI